MFIYNGAAPVCNLQNVVGSYTLLLTDDVVFVDATNGNAVITLPDPADVIAHHSRFSVTPFWVKKIDSSANTVTVSGQIDGAANYVLSVQYQSVTVIPDKTGTTYYVL